MTSAPVPREPADSPSVNVLRSSLALFSLYIATTVIVSLALAAAGFADPVMDMERIELTYASPRGLLRDQRLLGVRDGLFGPMGFREGRRVFRAWQSQKRGGRLPATFEIVYGHAWKAEPKASADGRAIIRFHK